MTQMNLPMKQKQTHRHRKQTCDYQRGLPKELGIGTYIHTTISKADKQRPTV